MSDKQAADPQFDPRPVTDKLMEWWEHEAALEIPRIRRGAVNWPMMVRSLIAEVRRLQARHPVSEAAEAADWLPIAGLPAHQQAMVGRWNGTGSGSRYWHQTMAAWFEHRGKREWTYAQRDRPSPFYDDDGDYAEPTHFHPIRPPPATGK